MEGLEPVGLGRTTTEHPPRCACRLSTEDGASLSRPRRENNSWRARHVKAEVVRLVEPADSRRLRLPPRHCLLVLRQLRVLRAPRGPRRPASHEVVLQDPQRMHHRQQLQHVRRVIPLRRRQLAALVSHRVQPAILVGLRPPRRGRSRPSSAPPADPGPTCGAPEPRRGPASALV